LSSSAKADDPVSADGDAWQGRATSKYQRLLDARLRGHDKRDGAVIQAVPLIVSIRLIVIIRESG
jgi:hypothetical protein